MPTDGSADVPTDGSDRGSLLRSSAVMAAGTTLSRVLGFVRAVVIAYAIGLSLLADTYNVANSLPNILYILTAGGALNAVFVPQLVRAMREPDEGAGYADRLLTLSLVVLAAITVLATALAPYIIRLYTGDSWTDTDVDVATAFAFWCLPQIFFYGLFTMLGQVLNARGRFGPMMWTPILNNVVVIATGVVFIAVASIDRDDTSTISTGEIALLGAGTTLGIVVQSVALIPVLRRSGYHFRPRFDFRGMGLRKAGTLASWTLLFVAVNQLGYLVVVRVATGAAPAGEQLGYGVGFSAYQNAYLIFLLPHAIATVSLVTALLPRMSRAAAEGRLGDLRDDVSAGLRTAAVATVLATAAFLALGRHFTTVMYAPRNGVDSARYVGWVLTAFAVGLVFFSAQHLVLRGFYALEDTRTPFLIQLVIVAVNVSLVLAAAYAVPARERTIAMAGGYAASYAIGLVVSTWALRRRVGRLDGAAVVRTHARLVAAAAVGGTLGWGAAAAVVAGLGDGAGPALLASAVGGLVLVGAYVVVARLLKVGEVADLASQVRRRIGR
jgi:putative peptidoglycan lipid II flippase